MNSERPTGTTDRVPSSPAELGTRIARVADLLGSRKKAAEVAQVSTDQLARYINNTSQPGLAPMARLCVAANVSLDWLATGAGTEPNHARDHPAGYHAEAAPQAPAAGEGAYEGWIDPEMLKVIVRVIAEYERDYEAIIDPHAKAELTALLCQVAGRLDDRSETSVARAVVDILKRAA